MFPGKIMGSITLALLVLAGFATAQTPGKETAAIAAAERWLTLVDDAKYDSSWQEAAVLFKNTVAQEQWLQILRATRAPLGRPISRKLASTLYQTALPGAPDGEYVIIQFKTVFENKKSSTETVTPMLERDGSWRVSGYYIR
ncbi:MAG: DUF4019 domain-containing protein [Syntrophales bacterium]|nr:DUF4019 domain-containing protein [Syntrophales bacterium]